MNVVMASSDMYSKLALTTFESLFLHNRDAEQLTIYYIGDKITAQNQNNLTALVNKFGGNIIFLPMPENINKLTGSDRNGQTVFCYCYIQDLLPTSVEKVLLLEPDQIIVDSLKELYDTDISDCYIAATDDLQSHVYKQKIGMKASSPYVNCGMILYNLKKWREDNLTEKITAELRTHEHMFYYDVQDVINYIVEGSVRVLPPKFNCTTGVFLFDYEDMIRYRRPSTKCSREEYEEGKKSPVIVHFTKNQIIQPRPWIEGCCHPYKEHYMEIRARVAMSDEPLWEYRPGKLNQFANFLYMKVSRPLTAFTLGIVHAYLYPAFLYRILFRSK